MSETADETPEIRPALSAEEWKPRDPSVVRNGLEFGIEAEVGRDWLSIGWAGSDDGMAVDDPRARHALAALALHEQPFGFTWEDVRMCRALADDYESLERRGGDERRTLLSIADRIEALLPPNEE